MDYGANDTYDNFPLASSGKFSVDQLSNLSRLPVHVLLFVMAPCLCRALLTHAAISITGCGLQSPYNCAKGFAVEGDLLQGDDAFTTIQQILTIATQANLPFTHFGIRIGLHCALSNSRKPHYGVIIITRKILT
jgi:hypothetical protein